VGSKRWSQSTRGVINIEVYFVGVCIWLSGPANLYGSSPSPLRSLRWPPQGIPIAIVTMITRGAGSFCVGGENVGRIIWDGQDEMRSGWSFTQHPLYFLRTHSRHARHALRRQPACAWPQHPPLRSHRALKNETPAATSVFIGADAKNAA
jgi:hypothetical protein